ncbi:hypothetical protein TH25_23760 [Thalassospira profundimaris]|uniref:HTH araC/xylS-type domain-containing protein n=1 Tax=Thalassospira profundimaris TaxID=502049 RepID=A0A367WJ04_9PROT|nr:helix-turn-helix domain-containing protein [Thalassospira profundimaris]RCK41445.1 hypothetical protein TH25_23760 [Thalassospira profundimaris]
MPTHVIEKSVFDTSRIEERLRYDVWRESISCVFDVDAPRENRDPRRFNVTINALRVGDLMLSDMRSVAQFWQRRAVEIARDGLDHFMFQLFLEGSAAWEDRYGQHTARAGDILVFDLAREMQSVTTDLRHLTLIIPRHHIVPLLNHPDQHNMRILPASMPIVQMLAEYIMLLNRNLPLIDKVDGNDLMPAVTAMVASCLNSFGPVGRNAGASTNDDLVNFRIRSFIRQNLGNPDLDVNRICDACGISRSALYRLFQEEGGVRHFLREQRLDKAMRDLLAQSDTQIAVIARENGFSHANDFSRAFRRRFGMTPRELRSSRMDHDTGRYVSSRKTGPEYENWLRKLGVTIDTAF